MSGGFERASDSGDAKGVGSLQSGRREFVLFVAMSGLAAAVNVGSRVLFSMVMSFPLAVTFAYVCGIFTAFVLNRLFVFRLPARSLQHQATWFVLINLVGLLQTLAVSVFLERWGLDWMGWKWSPALSAHLAGVAAPILSSYLGHKHITFRRA